MKKILMYGYGSVDILKEEDVPVPEPVEDEVLVKVFSASVNDPDIAMRRHGPFLTMPKEMRPVLPHMTGEDFSGVVTAVGKGVQRFHVGDHVIGINLDGTTAEYITVNENSMISRVPDGIDLVPLGAFYVAAATGWAAVVLNGMVKDMDLVVNLTGSETLEKSYRTIKKGGILTSTNGVPDMEQAASFGIKANYTMGMVSQADMAAMIKMYQDGELKIHITETYPFNLESIKQAHLDFEKGPNQGKHLIVIRER